MLKAKAIEINKKLEELKQKLIDMVNGLPDSPDIKKLDKNCYLVSSTLLARHDNWSPGYWMSNDLKETLTRNIRNSMDLDSLMSKLIERGTYKIGDKMQTVHPYILKQIKEIWYGHGKD